MILGLGTDIVNIPRIEELVNEWEDKFIKRFFSALEIEKLDFGDPQKQRYNCCYLAKRFAAKEAFVKAIGTGFRAKFKLKDIAVTNLASGKPELILQENVKENVRKIFNLNKNPHFFISLSDDYPFAQAVIIIEA